MRSNTIMQLALTRPMSLKRARCTGARNALLVRPCSACQRPQVPERSVTSATLLPEHGISWQNGSMRDIERVDCPFVASDKNADFLKTATIKPKEGDNNEETF